MRPILLALSALLLQTACASTGATFRSGVGDAFPERPPYYAGAPATATPATGHLPVAFQRGASQSPIFDPRDGAGSPAATLAEEMTAFLDSLNVSVRLVEGRRVSAVAHRATTTPPDVYFGCITEGMLPGNDCVERGDSALGRGRQAMRLAVGRPSVEWTDWLRDMMGTAKVERTLVVTLEVAQYLPRQTGWRGNKEVLLGTGHTAKLSWLTSLETPVMVLQVTGVLVDSTGKAQRIGAEGFLAVRSNLLVSAIGGQTLLRDEHVTLARTSRREDLPGSPLAWQVAVRQLVAGLTGRSEIVRGESAH